VIVGADALVALPMRVTFALDATKAIMPLRHKNMRQHRKAQIHQSNLLSQVSLKSHLSKPLILRKGEKLESNPAEPNDTLS
jgi:hypothetical protein